MADRITKLQALYEEAGKPGARARLGRNERIRSKTTLGFQENVFLLRYHLRWKNQEIEMTKKVTLLHWLNKKTRRPHSQMPPSHATLPHIFKRLRMDSVESLAAASPWAASCFPSAVGVLRGAIGDHIASLGDDGGQGRLRRDVSTDRGGEELFVRRSV